MSVNRREEVPEPERPDLSRLKRVKQTGASDAKRTRWYEDDDGLEIYYEDADELVDPDELQDLSEEASEDNHNEERLRRLGAARTTEAASRLYRSHELLRINKGAKRKATTAQRKMERIIQQKNLATEDIQEMVARDDFRLVSVPEQRPSTKFIDRTLGVADERHICFGCTRGVGLARISQESIEKLEEQIVENLSAQNICVASIFISQSYEELIRIPSNHSLNKDELPLPEWTPRSVYDHLTSHTLEASFVLFNCVTSMREHLSIIEAGLYRVPVEVYRSNREITPSDLIVDPQRHKMYMETLRMLKEYMNQDSEKMMWSNERFNMSSAGGRAIRPKINAVRTLELDSVYTKTQIRNRSSRR